MINLIDALYTLSSEDLCRGVRINEV
jgi:hypothetical protein